MNGIVTVTVATDQLDAASKAKLDPEVNALGFKTTVPCSEGGDMSLPDGTYVSLLQIQNQADQLRSLYRALVDVMRTLDIKGKYFIGMANEPISHICGKL